MKTSTDLDMGILRTLPSSLKGKILDANCNGEISHGLRYHFLDAKVTGLSKEHYASIETKDKKLTELRETYALVIYRNLESTGLIPQIIRRTKKYAYVTITMGKKPFETYLKCLNLFRKRHTVLVWCVEGNVFRVLLQKRG